MEGKQENYESSGLCYWEVLNDDEYICEIVIAVVSLCFLIYIVRVSCKFLGANKRHFDLKVKIIFFHLLVWNIFHFSKLLFSILVYKLNQINSQNMVLYSRVFCVVDSLSTMVLQGTLIIVPYIWTINIIQLLIIRQIQKSKASESDMSNSHNPAHNSFLSSRRILKTIYFYTYFRYLIYLIMFILQLVTANQQTQKQICSIINLFIISEAVLCSLIIVFGVSILFGNFDQLNLNSEKDKVRILMEYVLLMCFCATRAIVNFYFLIHNEKPTCQLNSQPNYLDLVVYQVLGMTITHFLPVLLILKFYNIKVSETQPAETDNDLILTVADTLLHSGYSNKHKS